PVQKDMLAYIYGEFIDDEHLFDLDEDCQAKIDIYIWLEGQDMDCVNDIGKEAHLFANIQFLAEIKPGSGMQEIEKGDSQTID
ncbi:MAG: hypothetical protein IKW18_02220, partial [Clostridia bacterium]|nr:hypothetical protein [Clostridia bacterium]